MKKILVTLLAVMTVFAAFAVTPDLTLSGSGSFEVLVDENGLDGSVSTSAGAEFEISQTATDATWSLGYTVALVDGTIDVTAGDFSLTTDLFELALTSNKFAITPAALSGLTVYYEDLDPDTDQVDKYTANPDAEWKLADDKFGADYEMDVAELGTLSVGGYYGVQLKTVSPYVDGALPANRYVYFMTDEDTILKDADGNPVPFFKQELDRVDSLGYTSKSLGINAGLELSGMLEGLTVDAAYAREEVREGTTEDVVTLEATTTMYDIDENFDLEGSSITTESTDITVYTELTDAEWADKYMAKVSYSKGYEVLDGLTVTPHGVFLYKTGYDAADASDNGWTAMKQELRGELSGEASQVTFGPDVAFSMDNISVAVNHDFTYKFAGDLHYILDNASIDFSMDMVSAGLSAKAWVADIMSSVDNDMSYAAVINPNLSVTPVENVTVSADVYYDLSDEEIEIPLGYEANVDYAFSPIHVGFTLANTTYDPDGFGNRTNNEDMHWYAYVKGSFEF